MADTILFTPGAAEIGGSADLDVNGQPDFIFGDDPRYQACLTLARDLKKQYGGQIATLDPKNAGQRARIENIERYIVTRLSNKVHEEFGDYNAEVSAGKKAPDNLHGDDERDNSSNPLRATELEKNSLVCRHYAPIANALCTQAGMKTDRVVGSLNTYNDIPAPQETAYPTPSGQVKTSMGHLRNQDEMSDMFDPVEHTLVLSADTGNCIDFCRSGSSAYMKPVFPVTKSDLAIGSCIFLKLKGDGKKDYIASMQLGCQSDTTSAQIQNRLDKSPSPSEQYLALTIQAQEAKDVQKTFQENKADMKEFPERLRPFIWDQEPPAPPPEKQPYKQQAVDAVKTIPAELRSGIKHDQPPMAPLPMAAAATPQVSAPNSSKAIAP